METAFFKIQNPNEISGTTYPLRSQIIIFQLIIENY